MSNSEIINDSVCRGDTEIGLNVINWPDLFNRMDGDEAYIKDTLREWVADYSNVMTNLNIAVKSQNIEDVFILSHKIKGSSAIFGADALSRTASKLETAGIEKKVDDFESFFYEVRVQFEILKSFVSQPDWVETAKRQCNSDESYILT